MAAQKEASIWASSAPTAARNTPRSRCSSAKHSRSSVFGLARGPPLMPQELRACDSQGAKLRPLVRTNTARPESSRAPDSLVFHPLSRRCLELQSPEALRAHLRKRLRKPVKTQNSDALTAQSNPLPSVPLHDRVHSGPETQQNEVR
jgi:hypothetical protein